MNETAGDPLSRARELLRRSDALLGSLAPVRVAARPAGERVAERRLELRLARDRLETKRLKCERYREGLARSLAELDEACRAIERALRRAEGDARPEA